MTDLDRERFRWIKQHLEATRPALKGKTLDRWMRQLSEYYDNHKEVGEMLKRNYPNIMDHKKSFIASVLSRLDEKKNKRYMTYQQALKKELHSSDYVSKEQVFKENALKGLHLDRDSYEDFRKFTRHQKINFEKMEYIKEDHVYRYETPRYYIFIKYENSPTTVKVWRVAK